MSYQRDIQVEFNHCDPAGIVFYPRYFEMTNSVVENFFKDALDYPFKRITMDEKYGVPTVRIETDFRAPSFLADILNFELKVKGLGGASVKLELVATCRGEVRMSAIITLVWINDKGKAEAWPAAIRLKFTNLQI